MKKRLQNILNSQKILYRYFRRKGLKRFFKENILEIEGSNKNKALSIALGIFIGTSPFWGFHSIIALSLAAIFRLNKFLAFTASQISIAPLAPFIIGFSMYFGSYFISGDANLLHQEFSLESIKHNLLQYLIGSFLLGIISSSSFGFLFYLILKFFSKKRAS